MRARELAAAIVKAKAPVAGLARGVQPMGGSWGVISSIQTGPPPSLTLTLAGSSTTIAGVRYLQTYRPVVGDTVLISAMGHDLVVVDRMRPDGAGLGTLGYVELTSDSTSTTTNADVAGASVTVNVGAGRRIRVWGSIPVRSTVTSDIASVNLYEGATVLEGAQTAYLLSNATMRTHAVAILTPTTGSHTYKLNISRASGTGTISTFVTSSVKIFLHVEDVGT